MLERYNRVKRALISVVATCQLLGFSIRSADALGSKAHEGAQVFDAHALGATGINADGHREILGLQNTNANAGSTGGELLPLLEK